MAWRKTIVSPRALCNICESLSPTVFTNLVVLLQRPSSISELIKTFISIDFVTFSNEKDFSLAFCTTVVADVIGYPDLSLMKKS